MRSAIVWYGTAPEDCDALARIQAMVLGFYGRDDARVRNTVPATREAMAAAGKPSDARVYDNAGHGLLRQEDGRHGANLVAAGGAWARCLTELRRRLGEG